MTRQEKREQAEKRRQEWREKWVKCMCAYIAVHPESHPEKILLQLEIPAVQIIGRPDWSDDIRRTWRDFAEKLRQEVFPSIPTFRDAKAAYTFNVMAREAFSL